MSWPTGNVPPAVTAMRDMIVASATFAAAGGTQAKVSYPDKDLSALTFPHVVIVQEAEDRQTYSSGSAALPTGSLRLEYHQNSLVGSIETEAFGVAADIGASTTGLLIRRVHCGMASDPTPSQQASVDGAEAVNYRVVMINVEYGPSV